MQEAALQGDAPRRRRRWGRGRWGAASRSQPNLSSVPIPKPFRSMHCCACNEKGGMRHAALSPPSKEFAGSLERSSASNIATRFTTAYLGGGGLGGVGGGGLRAVTAKHCVCMAVLRWHSEGNEQRRLLPPLLTPLPAPVIALATAWAYCWMQAALFPSSRWTCSSTPSTRNPPGGWRRGRAGRWTWRRGGRRAAQCKDQQGILWGLLFLGDGQGKGTRM